MVLLIGPASCIRAGLPSASARPAKRTRCGAIAFAAAGLLLAGCAETSGLGGGPSGGVEFGSTIGEYQAAFADVDPIVLHAQSTSAQGSDSGRYLEDYFASVEEWSDGKVTFDVAFSNSVAAPTETDNALADGRLDIALVNPVYEPQEFPASAALAQAAVISDFSVIEGTLSTAAWTAEIAFATPEIEAEFADMDMKAIVPYYVAGGFGMYCPSSSADLEAFEGAVIGAGAGAQSRQIQALGASPVSVPFTEAYEALQRGVIQCTVGSPAGAVVAGYTEVAPHLVINPNPAFAPVPGTIATSTRTWDSLPLIARQLLWDRLDVLIEEQIRTTWQTYVTAFGQVADAGGSVVALADDAQQVLSEVNESLLEEVRTARGLDDGAAFVADVTGAVAKWSAAVVELGYTNEVDFAGFAEWYTLDRIDLEAYSQEIFDEIYLSHRPE